MENYTGECPKWRLEHASSGTATCHQAACKRDKVLIAKGELRIGTHSLFENDGVSRWYMAWRHWGCGTPHQIRGLKEVTGDDPTNAPGYDRLSPEAQEQVRLAFEEGKVTDKTFKGVNTDLAKVAKRYDGEITDAESYKVDVASRSTAGCRNSDCPDNGVKIQKGELRLGFLVPYDGEHSSWRYKHWKCISKIDLDAAKERYKEETLDGIDELSEELKNVILETFATGEVVETPKVEPAPPKKRAKPKVEKSGDDEKTKKPAAKKKKKKNKKRVSSDSDLESEPEYIPRKSKRRGGDGPANVE